MCSRNRPASVDENHNFRPTLKTVSQLESNRQIYATRKGPKQNSQTKRPFLKSGSIRHFHNSACMPIIAVDTDQDPCSAIQLGCDMRWAAGLGQLTHLTFCPYTGTINNDLRAEGLLTAVGRVPAIFSPKQVSSACQSPLLNHFVVVRVGTSLI